MRILHTADWHLGDRLGRIDRTEDLRRAVERVGAYCREHAVDVLLVAGDLFSEMARPDGLRDAISHLQDTFGEFLHGGGTILTLTGNHDNENFCQTLQHAMSLAAPLAGKFGDLALSGRLHLATGPTLLRLADRREGHEVQFLLFPYPTPARFFDRDNPPRYQGQDERNRLLQSAYSSKLREIQASPLFNPRLPTVLSAHVHVRGGEVPTLFRITEEEDVVLDDADIPTEFAYVALGHIHKAQRISGLEHVRYSGSIERLDLGEQNDLKGVFLVDVGPQGRRGEVVQLPLEATPIYAVELRTPLKEELQRLREQHPEADRDLVRIEFTYTAGVDDLEATLKELEEIFPRWYYRHWTEAGALGPTLTIGEAKVKSFEDTVRDYLEQELMNHDPADREAIRARAEALMCEVQA
jgi:exonuclease SbcD